MQQKQSFSRNFLFWSALSLVFFSSPACSDSTAKLPADTQMVLAIGKDGSVAVLDAKGKPVPKCQLCTRELEKQFGPHCKDATAKVKEGLCGGLTGVSVQDVETITLVSSRKNPLCTCRVSGGIAFCLPVGCNTTK
jgi:hypothetical protein